MPSRELSSTLFSRSLLSRSASSASFLWAMFRLWRQRIDATATVTRLEA